MIDPEFYRPGIGLSRFDQISHRVGQGKPVVFRSYKGILCL
jgi:hypothetical protein